MLTARVNVAPWRTTVLALTLLGICTVLGKVWLVDARPRVTPPVPVALPDAVPLPGWQLTESAPIAIDSIKGSRASHAYQFQRGAQILSIHVHYMAPWTDGNNSRFLFVNTSLRAANAQLQERFTPETGTYGVLTAQGRAYLTACINPKGRSTLTEQQATQNRYATGLRPRQVLRWLLGQENLWDGRCLWTLMAIPLPPAPANRPEGPASAAPATRPDKEDFVVPITSEEAYAILESAWIPWHRWWQANFPAPVPEAADPNQGT